MDALENHRFWLKQAKVVSTRSKDPRTKVGAIIVSPDNRQSAIGYNGMVAGIEETPEMWNDRTQKHLHVIHGEENALLNCPFETKGCTLYCTHTPCLRCLIRVLQSGIKKVYFVDDYSYADELPVWQYYAKYYETIAKIDIGG